MSYKNFELTDRIDAAVEKNDRIGIINTLTSSCYIDRDFSAGYFDDGVEYVLKQKNYSSLWEPFKNQPPLFRSRINTRDPSLSEMDFADSVAHLQLNFCPERVEDTRLLGQYLYSPKEDRTKKEAPASANIRSSSGKKHSQLFRTIAAVIAAVTVVGAAIALCSKLFSK